MASEAYVGIDVGKNWLDIAVYGQKETWHIANTSAGVQELIDLLVKIEPKLVVLEATAGYEQLAAQAILLKGIAVAVVNPTRIRALAKAMGQLAKTDTIDAHLIAEYAFKIQPQPQAAQEETEIRLKAWVMRREQLVEDCAAEQNRLGTAHPSVKPDIREHIAWMKAKIELLETEIKLLLDSLSQWQTNLEILDSAPGVGFITAISIIAVVPEIGLLNAHQVAALVGLAPFNKDSGQKRGKRRIFGGRKSARRVLYMACLSAIQHNPLIRTFYSRLIENGKLFKVAMTACMRKLLVILNAMVRDQIFWKEPSSSKT
jgi:transposase